ncbi:unnamed protein product [Durusdinium trenchii]|uniref:Uncharacterized protein n=4 Tax=Durusdinium trenchii TaxID=1381693 RepID=A0ABP0HBB6_9DINO
MADGSTRLTFQALLLVGFWPLWCTGYRCNPEINNTHSTRHALRVCERRLARQCQGQNQVIESPGCGAEGPDMPPPAVSLFGGTEPGELGCIGRSTQFARALWCLARHANKAFELFTGIGGGSSLVLAHALARRPAPGRFFTVDRDQGNAWHATQVLKTAKAVATVVPLEHAKGIPDSAAQSFGTPGSWILQGDVFEHPSLIEALCSTTDGMDLIMLDPPTDLRNIWPVLETACRPKFLAIHNANLPGHAGWIPSYLKSSHSTWYEIMNGSHPSIWEPGIRTWSLMARCW